MVIAQDPLDSTLMRLGDAEEKIEELRAQLSSCRNELSDIAGMFGETHDATFGTTSALVQRALANRSALRAWTCEVSPWTCGAFHVVANPRVGDSLVCHRCESTYVVTETDRSFRYEFSGTSRR